mgnify:CR=1 FL=1
MKPRKSDSQGFCNDLSFSDKLRKEGKSNEAFEVMLSAMTLEELISLKLECSSRLTNGKLYGFNLWSNSVSMVKEAIFHSVISIASTNKEATRILGITEETLTVLKKRYNIKQYSND